jgi:hypothetical protein
MRKIAVLLGCSLVMLCSCIGIDSTLAVKDDGSGTLALTYRVSHLVADVGLSSTGSSDVPLPLSRADFERSVQQAQGKVRLTRFSRTENPQDIVISVQLSFDSLGALAQMDAFRDAHLALSGSGGQQTFTQVIARAPAQAPGDQALRMYDALFSGYTMTFVVQAPKPIRAASLGTISADKRTVTWTAPVRDIVSAQSDLVLTVGW